jgi:hypothetical protein
MEMTVKKMPILERPDCLVISADSRGSVDCHFEESEFHLQPLVSINLFLGHKDSHRQESIEVLQKVAVDLHEHINAALAEFDHDQEKAGQAIGAVAAIIRALPPSLQRVTLNTLSGIQVIGDKVADHDIDSELFSVAP